VVGSYNLPKGDEMKDVDVYQDDSDKWVAVTADNTTYYLVNEAEACAFQRGYRVANGLDPMTGETPLIASNLGDEVDVPEELK